MPLDPTKNRKILLTGKFIYEIPRGYGAAEVIGYNNVSLIEALQRAFGRTVYYIEKPTVADIKEADIVLLSMGTRDKEAIERPFALPKEDESLMRYVTKIILILLLSSIRDQLLICLHGMIDWRV